MSTLGAGPSSSAGTSSSSAGSSGTPRSSDPVFPAPPAPSPNRPHLFELLADDQLRDLLHPVVKYILTYFTHRYPRYLLKVLNHHEEFFACLLLLLERHHLKRHNASLSEHFYGLRAVPVQRIPTPRLDSVVPPYRRLSRRQRYGLLFFLVGVPYIRARAQDYYERLGGGQDPESLPPDTIHSTTLLQKSYARLYPYLNLAFDMTLLGFDVAYLFDKTDYYRPWHRLLGVKIERDDGSFASPPQFGDRVYQKLPTLIPPLLLLLKASQWWYSPQSPRSLAPGEETTKSYHSTILPPRPLPIIHDSGVLPLTPPTTPPASPRAREVDAQGGNDQGEMYRVTKERYGDCPLCGKKWVNPAVLPSGWVVCWKCGFDAVEGEEEGNGRCPITGVAVGPGEMRRVLV